MKPEKPKHLEISLFTQSVYAHTLRQRLCQRLEDRCITIWNTLARLDRIRCTRIGPAVACVHVKAPL